MNEVTTTKERVIKASETCPDAKGVLKELFPYVFEEEWNNITAEIQFQWEAGGDGYYFLRMYHGASRSKSARIGTVYPKSGLSGKGLKIYHHKFKVESFNDAFRIFKKF